MAATKGHQLEQTAAGREVLLVSAEVLGEMKNACGKARDLVISTAGVVRVLFVRVCIDGWLAHFPLGNSAAAILMTRRSLTAPGTSPLIISANTGERN